jgi:peptidoglycan/LPS O-acetylase OafA/YrhL
MPPAGAQSGAFNLWKSRHNALDFVADRRSLTPHIGLFVLRSGWLYLIGGDKNAMDRMALFWAVVVVAIVVVALASARNRRPTPRSSWIALAVVVVIAVALILILSQRHGV